jgi:hypothetical protein
MIPFQRMQEESGEVVARMNEGKIGESGKEKRTPRSQACVPCFGYWETPVMRMPANRAW